MVWPNRGAFGAIGGYGLNVLKLLQDSHRCCWYAPASRELARQPGKPKRHRPYSLSRPRAGPSSLLFCRPPPTEGARDARGPKGPAGLDASRHRGLSKSLCLTFRSGSSDRQSVPQVRQTQGVPRAVFIGLLPSIPRWSLLIRVCPLGRHRDMSTERDPDRAGPLLTEASQTTVASGVPGAQQAR